MDILNDIQDIIRDIFDEEDLIITENTVAEDVEDWDSLAQMNIMVSISKHFNVKFSVDEIANLHNVGDIVKAIESKKA